MNRRSALSLLLASGGAASVLSLSGCAATWPNGFNASPSASGLGKNTALLLPLGSAQGRLAEGMQRAASLAEAARPGTLAVSVGDTQGIPALAARLAEEAVSGGSEIVLGPLSAAETVAVLGAVGERATVLSFSNDPALQSSGAYRLGVTPTQSLRAILGHAQRMGIRHVALVAPPGPFGLRSAVAAKAVAVELGLRFDEATLIEPQAPGLIARLRKHGGGKLPEAVLLPDGGPSLDDYARRLAGSDIQFLGTAQWSLRPLNRVAALEGALFSAPDPTAWTAFADAYRQQYRQSPGVLAGLAFDSVTIAQLIAESGENPKAAITRPSGFPGAVGGLKFSADGSAERALAILSVGPGGERVVIGSAGL